jgi:hypothetical protein
MTPSASVVRSSKSGGAFVEVGQQLGAPAADVLGEGVERR